MRVVIADDELLLREGLARLLTDAGFEVVGHGLDAGEDPPASSRGRGPTSRIVDIRMPPTHTDEGLAPRRRSARDHPEVGVLVLCHYVESRYAMRLLADHPERSGYLLKDRISDIAVLTDALHRLTEGESVVDPTIVTRLIRRPRDPDPLADLTEREREVARPDRRGTIEPGDR